MAVRHNFNFAMDMILLNHYHDLGHTELCVLCEQAKQLISAVTRKNVKCPTKNK